MWARCLFPSALTVPFAAMLCLGSATAGGGGRPTDCICPKYPWAMYDTYWSYYAIDCDTGTPVNFNGDPNLPPGTCPGPMQQCTDCGCFPVLTFVGPAARRRGSGSFDQPGKPKSYKMQLEAPMKADEGPKLNRKIVSWTKDEVVKLTLPKDSQGWCLARITLAYIDPRLIGKTDPPTYLAIGHEIENDQVVPSMTVSSKSITAVGGKVVDVQIGPISYHVVLSKDRVVDGVGRDPAAPAKKAK